jgi:hypothetical protein
MRISWVSARALMETVRLPSTCKHPEMSQTPYIHTYILLSSSRIMKRAFRKRHLELFELQGCSLKGRCIRQTHTRWRVFDTISLAPCSLLCLSSSSVLPFYFKHFFIQQQQQQHALTNDEYQNKLLVAGLLFFDMLFGYHKCLFFVCF